MMHILEMDKDGQRIPIIVLTQDAAEARLIKQRLHVAPRVGDPPPGRFGDQVLRFDGDGLREVVGPDGRSVGKSEQLLYSRTFSIAIVEPQGPSLPPWQSCAVPTVEAVRAATGAVQATFNVTHLLFTHPAHYFSVAGRSVFPGLQRTHGEDVLRVFVHGQKPLCPVETGLWGRQGRVLEGCGRGDDVYGFLSGVRGGHVAMLHEASGEALLTDVCARGVASGACVYGYANSAK